MQTEEDITTAISRRTYTRERDYICGIKHSTTSAFSKPERKLGGDLKGQ